MTAKPSTKYLVVVGGATASGKTSLAIQLAKYYNTSIISADSRQFYKELNIGVAKPTKLELQAAPHYFIGHKSIHQAYTAGQYERDALKVIDKLFEDCDILILVGGSGLFINAVLHGFHQSPKDDGTVRSKITAVYASEGLAGLQALHKQLDPEYAGKIDSQNPQRLMRAIERCLLSGQTHVCQTEAQIVQRSFKVIEIAMDYPRQELYDRINSRVDAMMDEGFLSEAKSLHQFSQVNALQTVGYSELFDHLSGTTSLGDAVELIKQNTRRYAKRQITWFKNKSSSLWFKPGQFEEIVSYIDEQCKGI